MAAFLAIAKFSPAIAPGLYLAYLVAAGKFSDVPAAATVFFTALGLNAGVVAAHAKIDKL
jgi:hypothetical protein